MVMKKFIVAILALVYISSSIGVTLHMHYCMGKVINMGLAENESSKCSKCGMEKSLEKNRGCCKDKLQFLKNDTDQKTTEPAAKQVALISVALPASFIEITNSNLPAVIFKNPVIYSSRRSAAVAVYIRYCVFLI